MQLSFSFSEYKKIIAISIFTIALTGFIWVLIESLTIRTSVYSETKPTIVHKKRLISINKHSMLFTAPIFGSYLPVNLADTEIKQSMLDVKIVGILFSPKESESQVMIRVGGGEEKYYFVGDILPGGAVIKRITKNGIVVLHNDSPESLSFPKNDLLFEAPAKPLIIKE